MVAAAVIAMALAARLAARRWRGPAPGRAALWAALGGGGMVALMLPAEPGAAAAAARAIMAALGGGAAAIFAAWSTPSARR